MKYAVDANLMVLLVVGLTRREAIARHRRLEAYTAEDFERLISLLGSGAGLIVSAYVMAEVSNLAVFRVRNPLRSEIRGTIKVLVESNPEIHVPCRVTVARPEFAWLGLADAALLEQCGADCILLTADAELAGAALAAGMKADHFVPAAAFR